MDRINYHLLQAVIDDLTHGVIYIDTDYRICAMNLKAKQILGITHHVEASHPAGVISPGDLVIISDNNLGFDDGGVTYKDLSLLNIHDKDIQQGFSLVAVGRYKDKTAKPVYKYLPKNQLYSSLVLETVYQGHDIVSSIDAKAKTCSILVDGTRFDLPYMMAVGHMVIIDHQTEEIKFFQTRGDTVRREPLLALLQGKPYGAKGPDVPEMEIVGKKLDSILEGTPLFNKVRSIMEEKIPYIENEILYVNNIVSLCTIKPIRQDKQITGILLNFIDTSELENMISIRNETLSQIESVYARLEPAAQPVTDHFKNIIGNSDAIRRIKYLAYKASQRNSNVIITGESGTGKTQLAYEIHKLGKGDAPFVEVNCNSIPEGLFESELFGYVGGSFTGALSSGKTGYLENANGGTLFLDEIGELPLNIQVKLLQVLQSKRFYRVGSTKPVTANVRVIAATNRNLLDAVHNGTFREDLYYRLNVFPITIPPLRERRTDIYLLIDAITKRICKDFDIPVKEYSGAALNKLVNYYWPGNVRELENVIERAITISESKLIFPEYLDIYSEETQRPLKDIIKDAERKAIIDTLRANQGDIPLTIQSLGISKSGFYDKVKKLDIDISELI